jgi:hypothetical protein
MVSSHLSLCHLGLQAESLALRVFLSFHLLPPGGSTEKIIGKKQGGANFSL